MAGAEWQELSTHQAQQRLAVCVHQTAPSKLRAHLSQGPASATQTQAVEQLTLEVERSVQETGSRAPRMELQLGQMAEEVTATAVKEGSSTPFEGSSITKCRSIRPSAFTAAVHPH